MEKKKKLINHYRRIVIVLSVLVFSNIITIFNSSSIKTYRNSEFEYSFEHPRSAKVDMLSSQAGPEISKADAISITFKSGKVLRLQAFSSPPPAPHILCTTEIQRSNDRICFSSSNTDKPLDEKEFRYLIKSFRNLQE